MKTIIKSFALALSFAVLTSVASVNAKPITKPASATASYKTGIYSSVDGKLNIALDKTTGGAVDIRFKDANGRILFAEHIGKKEKTSRIRLNLDELQDGTYLVEITNGVDITTHDVTISTQQQSAPDRVVALN
ncbi:T9SS type A sorting domain-containing protein [Spirosoma sp. SC4-14]|uniref:T9SS type A sorting domain-containing protein n=1 Tax=Spirosoma sp. SC4-14 TaxID=3128900 RepID=UPI0030CF2C0F